MAESSFNLIMHEVLAQKQCMDDLLAENHDLRRQLAELRAGQDIFVEILGKRFALVGEQATLTEQEVAAVEHELEGPSQHELSPSPDPLASHTAPLQDNSSASAVQSMPQSALAFTSILEGLFLDELSNSVTRPNAVLTEEEQDEHAALRRELIGSFLLE